MVSRWRWRPPRLLPMLPLLLLLAAVCSAFNLEPRIAIVKRGDADSYFGFSVSQHQVVSRDRLESLLLVGAPLASSPADGDTQPGVVYRCPLTAQESDCSPVDTMPRSGSSKKYRGGGSKAKNRRKALEESDGQWLGTVVQSQGTGKQVIVCAHRYVQRVSAEQRWGHGKCYTLSQSLKHSATWDPCEGRKKNRAHEEWGYCQAGTSALLTEDNFALIGSPGPFTWRGTVFAVSVEEDFLFRDKTHYHTPVKEGDAPVDKYSYLGMSLSAGNFLPPEETCAGGGSGSAHSAYATGAPRAGGTGRVLIFVRCDSSEVMRVQRVLHGDNFASSFGYSLAAADVDGDGRKDLFVGAPFYHRKGVGGAVYFYRNGDAGVGRDDERKLLTGTSESRFGFALASGGDINNDGLEDLLVGAPYDTDGGKVYVYMGKRDVGISTEKADQVISGSDIPSPPYHRQVPALRTFGYSLSGGIDMDMNNHSDIAVGAFESDAAVVIRSRPVIDIVTWFGKHPHRINPDLQGCESDLLSTEVCFVVESCFLIKNFPSNIETTYIRYALEAEAFPGGRRPVSRVRFGDRYSNSSHYRENIVPIQRNSLTGCFLETGYLKEGTADLTTPITFLLSLSLEQDEPRPLGNKDIVPNINQYPILNQQEARRELTIPFQKSCGGDELCNSNLAAELEVASADRSAGELEIQDRQEVVLRIRVKNTGEPAYAAVLTLHIDASFTYVGRSDNQTDINCQLVDQTSGDQPHDLASARKKYAGREESTNPPGSLIKCNLGNPYNGMRSDELVFRVVPTSSGNIAPNVNFRTTLTTTSEDVNPSPNSTVALKVVKRAEVSIRSSIQPTSIWYGGQLLGESAMKVMSDIGSKVSHTFQITNDGPWHVEQAEVLIDWPYQLSVPGRDANDPGKWLLYMSEPPEVSPKGLGSCFLNPRMVNHLGLRDSAGRGGGYPDDPTLSKRRKKRREAESRPPTMGDFYYSESVFSASPADDVAVPSSNEVPPSAARLHCRDDRTKCQVINCRLWQLRANESAVIRIRSRIWNSTLVDEFLYGGHAGAGAVAIETNARVVLSPDMAEHQDADNDVTVVSLVGYPSPGQLGGAADVPTWVILVAVAVGLLVVGVIAVVLQKIGFFKRKRVDDAGGGMGDDDATAALHRDLLISAKVQPSSATSAAAAAAAAAASRNRRRSKTDEYIS